MSSAAPSPTLRWVSLRDAEGNPLTEPFEVSHGRNVAEFKVLVKAKAHPKLEYCAASDLHVHEALLADGTVVTVSREIVGARHGALLSFDASTMPPFVVVIAPLRPAASAPAAVAPGSVLLLHFFFSFSCCFSSFISPFLMFWLGTHSLTSPSLIDFSFTPLQCSFSLLT